MTTEARPTPLGLSVLEHIRRGRVVWLVFQEIVVLRPIAGDTRELVDVSVPFADLRRARWVSIQPYDPQQRPLPAQVPCLLTPAGEDILIEAAQARKKKAGKR